MYLRYNIIYGPACHNLGGTVCPTGAGQNFKLLEPRDQLVTKWSETR